jgi:preprotein translocase subunit SecF
MDFRGKNIDLVGKMNLWFAISILVMLIGAFGWFVRKPNLGIDFKGGSQITYRIPDKLRPKSGEEATLLAQVNDAIGSKNITGTRTQIAGGTDLVVYTETANTQTAATAHEGEISSAIATAFKLESVTPEARELVGPIIGDELRRNAILGVVFGIIFIGAWIYIRYNFAGDGVRYAVAGIVSMLHDVFVLLGITALLRIEIDGAYIAALLTVVGYSINDSVVIFDRIRENLRLRRSSNFDAIVNESLLETMSRSINTGATVLIMLLALLFFGGESIYNFTLAMLIGIASGLYSSVFNASMLLVLWDRIAKNKADQSKNKRQEVTVRENSRSKAIKTR